MIVVTVRRGGERSGCLAGFHSQISIDPRRHLVGVSRTNHTYPLVIEASHVGVHLLAADQRDLARLFGAATGDEIDKFDRCAWRPGPHEVPILDDVACWFVGLVVARWDGDGDHLGLVLEPVEAAPAGDDAGVGGGGPLRLEAVADLEPGHPA